MVMLMTFEEQLACSLIYLKESAYASCKTLWCRMRKAGTAKLGKRGATVHQDVDR
jgi:hypothetical protein